MAPSTSRVASVVSSSSAPSEMVRVTPSGTMSFPAMVSLASLLRTVSVMTVTIWVGPKLLPSPDRVPPMVASFMSESSVV